MTIEILALLGFGRRKWVRTSRVVSMLAAIGILAGGSRAEAQAIFEDDFEQDSTVNGVIKAWDGPPDSTTMYLTDQMTHSERRAIARDEIPPGLARRELHVQAVSRPASDLRSGSDLLSWH